jgi:glutathione S-transferase
MLKIVVGNKNYSSWSMRGWIVLRHTGAPFEEVVVPLDQPDTAATIKRWSPSGRVPALIDGEVTIWDSIAICEYLNEKFPAAKLWPGDPAARAVARSVSAEMHSGFQALRGHCLMRIRSSFPARPLPDDVAKDVARVTEIWADCRRRFGKEGPYLFGAFSIADVMYAPVVSRFRTYSLPLEGAAKEYADALWDDFAVREWVKAAHEEKLVASKHE